MNEVLKKLETFGKKADWYVIYVDQVKPTLRKNKIEKQKNKKTKARPIRPPKDVTPIPIKHQSK